MLGKDVVLVTLYRGLRSVLSKTIGIGGSKYHIWCSVLTDYTQKSSPPPLQDTDTNGPGDPALKPVASFPMVIQVAGTRKLHL